MNFKDIKLKRTPYLFKNKLKEFTNLEKFNKNYILSKYGENLCNYSYYDRPVRSRLKCTLQEFYNIHYNTCYTFTRSIFDINNTSNKNLIINEINYPNNFFNINEIDKYIFYCGKEKSGCLPHSHGAALNLMSYGKKKWIFFDSLTKKGKEFENYFYNKYPLNNEWIDWYNNEYKNLCDNIEVIEFIQESNDIVFIPNNYNHTVYNLQETMGIVIELNN